jgi:succinyl-CoA synthetase beta subunit
MLEYEGKAILRKHGIATTPERVASSAEEALAVGQELGFPVVVKAQVLTGGRGKAGGIKLAKNADELRAAATAILGMTINGETCEKLLVAKACAIEKELYAGLAVDAGAGLPVLIFSTEGGVEIEEVAKKAPEKVLTMPLSSLALPRRHVILEAVREAGVSGPLQPKVATVVQQLIEAFFAADCDTLEINPLAVTGEGELIALDAKAVIDDSALTRQNLIQTDTVPASDLERRAQAIRVNYVALDGDVAIIAGGAGLAMATMDMVNFQNSTAASFLDLGGGISAVNMAEALRISIATKGVRGVVINVFGGINNCLDVAQGICEVLDNDKPAARVVVKMRGHSQDEGWAMLEERKVPIIKYGTTRDAVQTLLAGL